MKMAEKRDFLHNMREAYVHSALMIMKYSVSKDLEFNSKYRLSENRSSFSRLMKLVCRIHGIVFNRLRRRPKGGLLGYCVELICPSNPVLRHGHATIPLKFNRCPYTPCAPTQTHPIYVFLREQNRGFHLPFMHCFSLTSY